MTVPGLPDEEARRRALTDHTSTLIVEAGAGSGKTALMAGRVVMMMAAGIAPRHIVAITFTELAASELAERIVGFAGSLLEGRVPVPLALGLPGRLNDIEREHLECAYRSIDALTCTTIHGFCLRLIEPYPLESELDPGASISDPGAAALSFSELLEAWLSLRFGRDPRRDGLSRLPAIEASAGSGDMLNALVLCSPSPVLVQIRAAAELLVRQRTARAPAADFDPAKLASLTGAVDRLDGWYRGSGVEEESTEELLAELHALAGRARALAVPKPAAEILVGWLAASPPSCLHAHGTRFKSWGRKGRWRSAAARAGLRSEEGASLSEEGEGLYHVVGERYAAALGHVASVVLHRLVESLAPLRDLYADYKRKAALLDFDDLLYHARDLLRGEEGVRGALAARYPYVLIDEFQDTDPLQAEIVWRLCATKSLAGRWSELSLRPGSLFIVGDPKQAIYRFRGADVETYLEARDALTGRDPQALLEITANFRSVPGVIGFVNERFEPALGGPGQPGYVALCAVRGEAPAPPAVAAYEVSREGGEKLGASELRECEAGVVASLVERLVGDLPVTDADTGKLRPCRPGDVALLAPTGTELWIYERALEEKGLPIATQAGKGFFRRQEVQDLIALARAVADRRDTLALGALLRGPLVGLTEGELLDAVAELTESAGSVGLARLRLWSDPGVVTHAVLREVLGELQRLARAARRTTPHQLLSDAVDALGVRALLTARHPRGAERALANVELFLEMARAYDARGLLAFVRDMRVRWEDAEREVEGRPDAEEEAVTLITIHSAKGLEWPVVIPINTATRASDVLGLCHRRADDTLHATVLGGPTAEYEAVKAHERTQLTDERRRLCYVACTRARDLLLLPRFGQALGGSWAEVVELGVDALPLYDASGYSEVVPPSAPAPSNAQSSEAWSAEERLISAARRTLTWHRPSLHEAAREADPEAEVRVFSEGAELESAGPGLEALPKGGALRGTVLHKLMEEILTGELETESASVAERARVLIETLGAAPVEDAAEGPSPKEMAGAVERTVALPAVAELFSSLEPEVPIFRTERAEAENAYELVAGVADALALGSAGEIRAVIDWKSDVDPDEGTLDRYRQQLEAYLAATGAPRGLLVFMTSGKVVEVARTSATHGFRDGP